MCVASYCSPTKPEELPSLALQALYELYTRLFPVSVRQGPRGSRSGFCTRGVTGGAAILTETPYHVLWEPPGLPARGLWVIIRVCVIGKMTDWGTAWSGHLHYIRTYYLPYRT